MSLVSGALFIVFGLILKFYPPAHINSTYGYRTPMSRINQDTWDTAQKYGGLSLVICGILNIIFGFSLNVFKINQRIETVQLLFLLLSCIVMIILDEIHLKSIFNKNGIRKTKHNSNNMV